MTPGERLRQRMAAAGVDLSPELADVVIAAAGPMVTALDDLVAVAPENVEPFHPAERLPEDAVG